MNKTAVYSGWNVFLREEIVLLTKRDQGDQQHTEPNKKLVKFAWKFRLTLRSIESQKYGEGNCRSSFAGLSEASTLAIGSGDLRVGLIFIPIEAIAVYWCGFSNRTPYLIWEWTWWGCINFEPKYMITVLTREDWTKCTGTPPTFKENVWFRDGFCMRGEPGPRPQGNQPEGG
jgi:hypothetical protein